MYCDQRSQYIRLKSKKNSFRGNYSRVYVIFFVKQIGLWLARVLKPTIRMNSDFPNSVVFHVSRNVPIKSISMHSGTEWAVGRHGLVRQCRPQSCKCFISRRSHYEHMAEVAWQLLICQPPPSHTGLFYKHLSRLNENMRVSPPVDLYLIFEK